MISAMKVVLQKVKQASVSVDGSKVGSIDQGYLILLGVLHGDTAAQAELLAQKITSVRLFDGEDGKINDRNILDVQGGILVVSQFTLAGRLEKGNRPDYTQAEDPDAAKKLYEYFMVKLKELGVQTVESGEFGAYMDVTLTNDGPVTLLLEK